MSTSMCLVVLFHSFLSGSKLRPFTPQYKYPTSKREDLTRVVMCRWRADASTTGELAQLVERPLCMREVPGSMPGFSKFSAIALGSGYFLGKDHIFDISFCYSNSAKFSLAL